MTEICEVIITGPNAAWLAEFTRALVADRLAACGQNIAPVRSIYRWQGEIEDESEARVALHTRREHVPAIVARADRDHPYEVPCVIVLPVLEAAPRYAEWVIAQTGPA